MDNLEDENDTALELGKKRKLLLDKERELSSQKQKVGESYVSTFGQEVEGKKFNEKDCGCAKNCSTRLSEEERLSLFNAFWKLENFSKQDNYLCGLIKRVQIRSNDDKNKRKGSKSLIYEYSLNAKTGTIKVCKRFFLDTFCISNGRVSRALRKEESGRNADANAEENINQYLNPNLNITKMYELYKKDCIKKQIPEENIIKEDYFRNICKDKFNLPFYGTSKCDTHDSFKRNNFIEKKAMLDKINVSKEYQENFERPRLSLDNDKMYNAGNENNLIKTINIKKEYDIDYEISEMLTTNANSSNVKRTDVFSKNISAQELPKCKPNKKLQFHSHAMLKNANQINKLVNSNGHDEGSFKTGPIIDMMNEYPENILFQWIMNSNLAGFHITESQLLDCVQMIMKDKELKTSFTNGRSEKFCTTSFINRHPELFQQDPLHLNSTMSEEIERNWFATSYNYLEKINMQYILKFDNRVFICEESTMFLNCEEIGDMMVKRWEETVNNIADKERMTMVLLANAAGTLAPPLIVTKSQRLSKVLKDSIPKGWEMGRSENGWTTSENFLNYVIKTFYPWLMSESIQLPIILFLNATVSPLSCSLTEFCKKYGIILVALYSNDNLPQPLDVCFYRSLNEQWKKVIFKTRKSLKGIKKEDFCPLLKNILSNIDIKSLISTGFKMCKLFPFVKDVRVSRKIPALEKSANLMDHTFDHNFEEIPQSEIPDREVHENCGHAFSENLQVEKSPGDKDKNDGTESLSLLRGIEKRIGDKIVLFENCNGQWNGKVEDTSLFELWFNLKRECGEIKDSHYKNLQNIVKEEMITDFDNYQYFDNMNIDIVKSENI